MTYNQVLGDSLMVSVYYCFPSLQATKFQQCPIQEYKCPHLVDEAVRAAVDG